MPGSFRIGKLLGIPLQLNISWFIIFALVTFSLVAGQFPAQYPFWSRETYLIAGLGTSLLFFGSVVIHELSHSIVARFIGLPVKSITLFIFGGVAQISRDASRPAGELVMAAAGPFSSFVLAGVFTIVWAVARSIHEPTTALAGWLALINFSLGAFNLLPGFPMDGGRILRSLIWWATGSQGTATKIAVSIGHVIAYLMLLGGILLVVLNPHSLFSGVWLMFIGWFLNQAAAGSAHHARIRDALHGYNAGDLMSTNFQSLPEDLTIEELLRQRIAAGPRSWFLVVRGPFLRGLLSLRDVRKVPRRRWSDTQIASVMQPIQKLGAVSPQVEALEVLEEMDEKEVQEMPVVEQGTLVGVVTRASLLRAAQLRHEFGF